MATVVVTFFLIARFCVFKMDADFKEKRRKRVCSDRQKRWSMNPQRLEEVLAELMRPIRNLRHIFDTDLSGLLEEYLTAAGLHQVDVEEGGVLAGDFIVPNFAELALLLQQSACIYGRKVDCLYQHVLSVSESLLNSTLEISNPNDSLVEDEATGGARRRRQSSSVADFAPIELQRSACCVRGGAGACGAGGAGAGGRAPPVLPRPQLELEPRALPPHALQLLDYAAEPVGLLQDFHVAWRLQNGQLVEELEMLGPGGGALRLQPIPLMELQDCIAAAEAAYPPPPDPSPPPADTPPPAACSTPLPPPSPDPPTPPVDEMPPPALPLKKERKRRNDINIDLLTTPIKFKPIEECLSVFSGWFPWRGRVLAARAGRVRRLREALRRRQHLTPRAFRGFPADHCAGFQGWSAEEGAAAREAARKFAERWGDDSDDDGFFEQSSDSDASRLSETLPEPEGGAGAGGAGVDAGVGVDMESEGMSWARARGAAAARRAGAGAGALDVRALGARLLVALPAPPAAAPVARVLRRARATPDDVSHLLLATLFLANAGNVEIVPGPALSLGAFSLRLRDPDTAQLQPHDLDPAPPQPAPPRPAPPRPATPRPVAPRSMPSHPAAPCPVPSQPEPPHAAAPHPAPAPPHTALPHPAPPHPAPALPAPP